ncbi:MULTISPECIES: hypothetical protein [Pseudomonas]|uniref:Uncharacterized protein n=1 Tax=Pseudomonas mosselii TaxID=78327 RepID=A0A7W2K0S9_9PSED|nr:MULTISPECIES: hypothetical protein [Pseudomonas]MBA6068672.1 hypothetical protein [Pseudomonas mosselii]
MDTPHAPSYPLPGRRPGTLAGGMRTPKGKYDFIQVDGKIYIAPPRDNVVSGHLSLSKGGDVDFAGQIHFSQKGGLKNWDNHSGHYQPPAGAAPVVKLPQDIFKMYE